MEKALYDAYESAPLVLIDIFHLPSSETPKYLFLEPLAEITSLSEQSLKNSLDILENGTKKGVAIKNTLTAYVGPGRINITFSSNYFFAKTHFGPDFYLQKKSN